MQRKSAQHNSKHTGKGIVQSERCCAACCSAAAHFNADQMAFIAHTPCPLLLRLCEEAASANANHTVVVVMPPSPVLKEGPHQLCKALLVCIPKALQGLNVIKVVTIPLPYSPASTKALCRHQ